MITTTNKKWLLWLIRLTIILVVGFFMVRGYFRLTDDFRISNMTYEIPHNPDWEIPPLSPEEQAQLDACLNQPYNYIGKGAQSYAFASEDGKYVIKFFKFKHLKPNWIVDALPDWGFLKDYRNSNRERKNRLIISVFSGYKLAYDEMRNESGIIYLHLNKSQHLKQNLVVYDKIGLKWEIDLDNIVFVIQEKAKTTRNVLSAAFEENNIALAEHRIEQIFDLYLFEYHKGIYDRDHGVLQNTGFVGDKPIHLDVGKLTKDDKMKLAEYYKPDLRVVAGKFEYWIRENFPAEYPEMKLFLEKEMTEKLGEPFTFSK